MSFKGFDTKDGAPLYDTLESAIERAKMLKKWNDDPNDPTRVFVHRKGVPLWFAHLVQYTRFERLAYYEEKI